VALAPARTGGGAQLKLTESVARGRCVVTTPFAAKALSAPLAGHDGVRVGADADGFAAEIIEALRDRAVRHTRERSAWTASQSLDWPRTTRPLVEAIDRLAAHTSGRTAGQAASA
jgi:hypothetical protein